jgi:hypothetical protein
MSETDFDEMRRFEATNSNKEGIDVQKKGRQTAHRLPATLRPLFWDHDFATLRWETDRDLVIGRVLASGTWNAVRWLRARLPNPELRAWLQQRQGAGLSNRQLRFWELILELPHREVNGWLANPARQVWEGR